MTSKPVNEARKRFEQGRVDYRGFQIVAKCDYFDFLSYRRGFYISEG